VIHDIQVASPSELLVAACSDKQLRFFLPSHRGEATVAIPEKASLTGIAITRDGNQALVNLCGGESQELHLWDLKDLPRSSPMAVEARLLMRFRGHTQEKYVIRSCFGGVGDAFIGSGSEDNCLHVWHRESGRLLESLAGHTGMVNSVAWNPANPHVLATASDDQTIRVWLASALGEC